MMTISSVLEVENFANKYSVVIFDLDDTLYLEIDYVKSGFKAISDYLKDISIYYELLDAFRMYDKPLDYVLEKHNLINLKDECLTIYRNHLPNIALDNDIYMMLVHLKKNNKLCLITDGRSTTQRNKISALKIDKIFDLIIVTDELGGLEFRKPCTKAFEIAQRFFSVGYKQMVYI